MSFQKRNADELRKKALREIARTKKSGFTKMLPKLTQELSAARAIVIPEYGYILKDDEPTS